MAERKLLGYADVDSGQLLVTDPCYLEDWEGHEWNEGTHKPGEYSYGGACDATVNKPGYGQLNHKMGHGGAGVAIGGFGGDGSFPVFGEFEDGYLVRVIIDFGFSDE